MLSPDANINYESSENAGTLTRFPFASGTIQYLYFDAALGCYNNGDPQKCQTMANLCVLVLYDETTNICKQFKDIVQKWNGKSAASIIPSGTQPIQKPFYKDQNWKDGLPWLYYDRSATEVLFEPKRVKFRASFGYENR